jgi:regulator of sirC expression with transglutaminase-like and TPR domain
VRTLAAELFKEMIARPDEQVDLASATLLIALDEYPALDIQKYLREIDDLASAVQSEADWPAENTRGAIEKLNRFLFRTKGFRGNHADYYDPRNSYLNEVLERRLGIPITLSVLFMEVGRRLGLRVEGVGMPGHFIVKCVENDREILVDPFTQGEILLEAECRRRMEQQFGASLRFDRSFLDSVNKHQILTRMLRNLKGIYWERGEFRKAVGVLDKILLLNPEGSSEFRDRATAHFKLSNFSLALADWVRYLEMEPQAKGIEEIKRQMNIAGRLLALRN